MKRKVYLIRSDCGAVKVGVSIDPQKRLSQLEQSSPRCLELVRVYDDEHSALRVERLAHRFLSNFQIKNEWFDASVCLADKAIRDAIEKINSVTPGVKDNLDNSPRVETQRCTKRRRTWITEARTRRSWTIRETAKKANVPFRTWTRWEYGESFPEDRFATVVKLFPETEDVAQRATLDHFGFSHKQTVAQTDPVCAKTETEGR